MTDTAAQPPPDPIAGAPPKFGLHLVTLGVADLARAAAFYAALGAERRGRAYEGVAFFQMGGVALSLYPRTALAQDAALPASSAEAGAAFSGITLACNLPDEAAVTALMGRAEALGARVLKPAQTAFWGGFSGYVADLDGHVWEFAHNPFFPFDAQGHPVLPD